MITDEMTNQSRGQERTTVNHDKTKLCFDIDDSGGNLDFLVTKPTCSVDKSPENDLGTALSNPHVFNFMIDSSAKHSEVRIETTQSSLSHSDPPETNSQPQKRPYVGSASLYLAAARLGLSICLFAAGCAPPPYPPDEGSSMITGDQDVQTDERAWQPREKKLAEHEQMLKEAQEKREERGISQGTYCEVVASLERKFKFERRMINAGARKKFESGRSFTLRKLNISRLRARLVLRGTTNGLRTCWSFGDVSEELDLDQIEIDQWEEKLEDVIAQHQTYTTFKHHHGRTGMKGCGLQKSIARKRELLSGIISL